MVKITTKQQFKQLIQEMENNKPIALGVRSCCNAETWKNIAEKLNSLGPPIRTPEEWQRVWIHFKAKLKRKMSTNSYITNGKPPPEVGLSPLEQVAADMLQLNQAVSSTGSLFDTNFVEVHLTELQDFCELQQQSEEQPKNKQQSKVKNVPQIPGKRENIEEQKYTGAQSEGLYTLKTLEQQPTNHHQSDIKNLPRKRKNAEDIRSSHLHEQTGTQTEGVNKLNKIEETLHKAYEVLKDIRDIKKRKLDMLLEEHSLSQKIKEKKLEILERQLSNLNS